MEIKKSNPEINEKVHHLLQEYNRAFMQDSEDYSYYIEENGEIAAGIVASAIFDTVEVEFLCVAEEYRGQGYGKQLLEQVEKEASAKQIKRIILNTYSFQAPDFYKKWAISSFSKSHLPSRISLSSTSSRNCNKKMAIH
ncbi:N-acetyltransferase [Lactobacillus nasalidis]|uniref:N-acetyltransferase n=1 Tax=Lactobacillus nasalidis TaxID=2797258 RepID=A0ABQ3W4S9_9LACO|nr:GNAT family N-acetyltransferase [Lactobacillus nasalidis]GHV97460.1 N-acetyltransferase [Lactobacillus nasalidis]GHV99511.1 N-acetyltransferase [Lactobacillus nasalidis]GHW00330.1 N-acetyltransferase [Lactobacillus nasalidis]